MGANRSSLLKRGMITPERDPILWWRKSQSPRMILLTLIYLSSLSPPQAHTSKMLLTNSRKKSKKQWSIRSKRSLLYSVAWILDSSSITMIRAIWTKKASLTSKDAYLSLIPTISRGAYLNPPRNTGGVENSLPQRRKTKKKQRKPGPKLKNTTYHLCLISRIMKGRSTFSFIIWPTMNQGLLFELRSLVRVNVFQFNLGLSFEFRSFVWVNVFHSNWGLLFEFRSFVQVEVIRLSLDIIWIVSWNFSEIFYIVI